MQDTDDATAAALGAADLDAANLTAAERTLLEFAVRLTDGPADIDDADVQTLRDVGWTEPQIAEAVYTTALFAMFNRVADAFGLEAY